METTPVLSRRVAAHVSPSSRKAGLDPYVPSSGQPWDTYRVAHLLRRAGFGASRVQIDTYLTMSPGEVVDALVDEAIHLPLPPPPEWVGIGPPPNNAPQVEKDEYYAQNNVNRLKYRAAWLRAMRSDGLREKMALFWSNHFVTQVPSYGLAPFTVEYLSLLRTHALGNFKTFTHEVGLIPAMLLYLNGHQNRKNGPNENYARELCELFTMGITDEQGNPNYTQAEITELARALTGWRVNRQALNAYFEQNRFDEGEKTFFGRTGAFGYDDVIDIIFEERTASIAHHICKKLYRFFVYDEPNNEVISAMAAVFVENNFEMAPVVRALLKSAHFFDSGVIGAKIKSPMEFLMGLLNEADLSPEDDAYETLYRWGNQLSQRLFDPPNVAGWPEHHAWVSTGTMPQRWNYGSILVNGNRTFDGAELVELASTMSAPDDPYVLVRDLCDHFFTQPLQEAEYQVLTAVLLDGTPDYEWSIESEGAPNRLRGFLNYLVQLPEYQLV